MSTKTCKRCGWEYPDTQQGRVCRICGEPFEKPKQTHCVWCGAELTEKDKASKNSRMCLACFRSHRSQSSANSKTKLYGRLEKRFDDWLDKVRQVPRSYPTLTEKQWLEACSFFDGCARCNNEVIDTRGFFISKSLGGRYCDWNVIPLCERCAKIWQLDRSMFVYAMHKDQKRTSSTGPYEYRDNLEKIVEYLEVRLDAAIGVSGDTAKHAEDT